MLNVPYSGSISRLALEWYYIVGPVLLCIVIFTVGWYICKRRRAGKKILLKLWAIGAKKISTKNLLTPW